MKKILPREVTGADVAFGACKGYLPEWEDIPEEFKQHRGNEWVDLADRWFFRGLRGVTFTPKEGIDQDKALRHIGACLASFEPKHERKIAGCAYLFSLWFESVQVPA